MTDETAIEVVIVASIAIWVGWYAMRALAIWRHLRGERIVTCPETGKPAAVRIDVGHALATLVDDLSGIRLQACSRWAERGPCDQVCAADAERYDSAASRIVYAWAQDKACVYCGKPVVEEETLGHHAALLGDDGVTREWLDIPGSQLPDALAHDHPVCWDCHVAESFRRAYPELVTDRQPFRRD